MLFDAVLAAAGLATIIPLFVPSRWRRPAAAINPEPYQETEGGGYADPSRSPWPPADYG